MIPKSVAAHQVARTYCVATFRIPLLGKQIEHSFWLSDMDKGVAGMDLVRQQHKWAPKGCRFDNVNRCPLPRPARARTHVLVSSSQTLGFLHLRITNQHSNQPSLLQLGAFNNPWKTCAVGTNMYGNVRSNQQLNEKTTIYI